MKQHWQKIAGRIDALTVRERVIVFVLAALIVSTGVNLLLIDPLFEQQRVISERIKSDQARIAEVQEQIHTMVRLQATDPDAEKRARLEALKAQAREINAALRDIEKGLVSPDKMAGLLEQILARHGKLRLISLKTLPASSIVKSDDRGRNIPAPGASVAPDDAAVATGMVYKHAVEITFQGQYLDMLDYVTALEKLPTQLFWSRAVLDAGNHAQTTLTLTLFTLSLDKQWLRI